MFAPLPLPLPSVHAAAIVAILEQARDSQLSRCTVVGPTTTAIAQRCQGTAVCSLPPQLQEQAREWPAMPRHCCPPCCQLVVAPASKGWLTAKALKRELKKNQNGHQFKGRVIRIVRIEALHAIQSMVDILGRPIWWCDVGHCVAVLENFVPPESVCIKSSVV